MVSELKSQSFGYRPNLQALIGSLFDDELTYLNIIGHGPGGPGGVPAAPPPHHH